MLDRWEEWLAQHRLEITPATRGNALLSVFARRWHEQETPRDEEEEQTDEQYLQETFVEGDEEELGDSGMVAEKEDADVDLGDDMEASPLANDRSAPPDFPAAQAEWYRAMLGDSRFLLGPGSAERLFRTASAILSSLNEPDTPKDEVEGLKHIKNLRRPLMEDALARLGVRPNTSLVSLTPYR